MSAAAPWKAESFGGLRKAAVSPLQRRLLSLLRVRLPRTSSSFLPSRQVAACPGRHSEKPLDRLRFSLSLRGVRCVGPVQTTLSPRSAAVSAPVLGASRVEGSWSAKVKEASFKREAPPPSASQAAKEGDGVLEEGTLAEEADCQEGAALDSLEILKNSAAAAEEVRRWLVNDDPEPPEPPRCALDLGAKVLSVDEDF